MPGHPSLTVLWNNRGTTSHPSGYKGFEGNLRSGEVEGGRCAEDGAVQQAQHSDHLLLSAPHQVSGKGSQKSCWPFELRCRLGPSGSRILQKVAVFAQKNCTEESLFRALTSWRRTAEQKRLKDSHGVRPVEAELGWQVHSWKPQEGRN